MCTVVLTVSETIMNEIREDYNKYKTNKLPPGSVFAAKTPGCTITGYRSGKVMFQGKEAQKEAGRWEGDSAKKNNKRKHIDQHQWSPPHHIQELSMIGSDEVGTGDFFGPITVAAVYAKKEQHPLLKELGVKDSKHLTDKKITEIAKDLLHVVPYSLLILHNKKYNELQAKGMSQGKMKALLHNRALLNVMEKIKGEHYDGILIDQFAQPDTYFRYLATEKEKVTSVYFATQAEGLHLSVAAASIIARYAFLKEMDKFETQFGFALPKGAGKQVDEAAAALISKYGESILGQCAKQHFANTGKAKRLASLKN
ncbi:ribonuclease HIII [Pueribacillus theae]|uniref:Ribonuclease HIII n=1 Tax=Pueribacillus theae TaxID=2171751 RepID=A0A2U1K528_9BACI|nr:ribonuclease HIII [Pueribacillus theae]PWA12304.1 ribonuclease HIII [Pueribacillus theae]